MPDRSERWLRLLSYGLGAILLLQFGRIVLRSNPLAHVKIPAVPTWAGTNESSGTKLANSVSGSDSTTQGPKEKVQPSRSLGTNSTTLQATNKSGTNDAGLAVKASNSPIRSAIAERGGTKNQAQKSAVTNSLVNTNLAKATSNAVAPANVAAATNLTAGTGPVNPGANLPPGAGRGRSGPGGFPGGFPGMAGGPGGRAANLPPEVQARVDRIVESEIFAPVMRPLPMALLGIAGNVAFLRAPNGQTGLVKENEEVGGIKLLRIGTNRVLIEEEGKKQELMIFSGLGGESLLPKPKENLK